MIDMNKTDFKILYAIIEEDFISIVLRKKSLFQDEEIRSSLSDAWFNRIKFRVGDIINQLEDKDVLWKLKQVGLTGDDLNIKIQCYNGYVESNPLDSWVNSNPPTKLPHWIRRFIFGLFDYFNTILGSLSHAIPGAELIKEFKDMIHFVIEYGTNSNVISK